MEIENDPDQDDDDGKGGDAIKRNRPDFDGYPIEMKPALDGLFFLFFGHGCNLYKHCIIYAKLLQYFTLVLIGRKEARYYHFKARMVYNYVFTLTLHTGRDQKRVRVRQMWFSTVFRQRERIEPYVTSGGRRARPQVTCTGASASGL
jgi:hypothetical protein